MAKKRKISGDPRGRSGGRVTLSQPKRGRRSVRVVPDERRTLESLVSLLAQLEERWPDE